MAGLQSGSHPTSRTQSPAHPVNRSQNATPSRKRSRSGSHRPSQSSGDPAEATLKELYLDEYTTRDQQAYSALEREDNYQRATLELLNQRRRALQEYNMRVMELAKRNPPRIVYPNQRRRFGNRETPELRVNRKDRQAIAEIPEELVPIRLELEFEKLRLRDTFTWNLNDRVVEPELFAAGLMEDFQVPPEAAPALKDQVLQSIQEQLQDYHPHPFLEQEPLDPHLPYYAYKNDEMRIKISINVTIGTHTFVDNFDWDINDQSNSPEEFARQTALDLSLSGEFKTAIAHSIREQCQLFTKSLFITNHPFDGRPIEDGDIQENLLPSPLPSVFRPFQQAKDYAPAFYELNDVDLDRQELIFSREQRQQKRSAVNRRGGPTLPSLKERPKTWRTSVISTVVPGAAEDWEASGILNTKKAGKRKQWNSRNDDSDISESEESDTMDSPARNPALVAGAAGTSRTRGMRGAASAAQVAMRANYSARSQTPEVLPEIRMPPRRYGVIDAREDNSVDPPKFNLRLKLPRQKYRDWWRNYKANKLNLNQNLATHSTPQARNSPLPGSMGPPTTPGMINRPAPHLQRHGSSELSSVQKADAAAANTPTPGGPPPGVSALYFYPPHPSYCVEDIRYSPFQYPRGAVKQDPSLWYSQHAIKEPSRRLTRGAVKEESPLPHGAWGNESNARSSRSAVKEETPTRVTRSAAKAKSTRGAGLKVESLSPERSPSPPSAVSDDESEYLEDDDDDDEQ